MCTVTFIPSADKIYFTSNRDEKSLRKPAVPPHFYKYNDAQLIYPKDAEAGGSWIALSENGNAAVLLNGGFVKHLSSPPYKKSRGLVLLGIIQSHKPLQYFLKAQLSDIEPFTVILLEEKNLFECRWTGYKKYSKELNNNEAYIWSSVTLYDEDIRQKREQWFKQWLSKKNNPNQKDILRFHQFAGDGSKRTGLLMNRDGIMRTVSITCIELSKHSGKMYYHDLIAEEVFYLETQFLNSATVEHAYND